jgi:recombination protein RecA
MGRQKKSVDAGDDIFAELAAETGGEVVGESEKSSSYYIDTGNLAINYCCSGRFIKGGIPGGRLTEIYGPSASSKSLLGTNFLFGCQKLGGIPVLIDSENAVNKDFIKKASHADLNKILRYTPETLEDCFHTMYRVIDKVRSKPGYEDKPLVIVYDSISVSPCKREFREVDLPEDYSKETFKKIVGGNEQPGERAKICSKELRKLNTVMEENNVSVVIMNQIRDKIGVLYGCFFGGSLVYLADGSTMKIKDIVKNKLAVEVLSYNTKTGAIEPKMVVDWHDNGLLPEGESFVKIKFRRNHRNAFGYLQCTRNHIVFRHKDDGIEEIPAGLIEPGDKLALSQPTYLSEDQWQIVYGSLLGDGEIRCPGAKRNAQLRFSQGKKQEGYIRFKSDLMGNLMAGPVRETNHNSYESETKALYELNEVADYKKDYMIPQVVADNLNELGLAIWYLDDGTFSGNYEKWGKGKSRIYCFKYKNKEIMLEAFKRLGLEATICKQGFQFDAENTEKLHHLICRFVPECMDYKIHPRFQGLTGFNFIKDLPPTYEVVQGEVLEVLDKETKLRRRYDITVQDNGTYVVAGAIVHNSPETTAGGGNALPFYASLRFRTQTQKKIEEKVAGLAKKKSIGINLKIQNKKNRSVRPFIEVENIPLFFEKGINPIGGLLGALLDADRLTASGAGNFKVKPEFIGTGEEEYKFKSSLERNDVPLQVLFDNPKLIDADTADQIREYLEPFKGAIEASDNPDVEAFDVSDGSDEEIDGMMG